MQWLQKEELKYKNGTFSFKLSPTWKKKCFPKCLERYACLSWISDFGPFKRIQLSFEWTKLYSVATNFLFNSMNQVPMIKYLVQIREMVYIRSNQYSPITVACLPNYLWSHHQGSQWTLSCSESASLFCLSQDILQGIEDNDASNKLVEQDLIAPSREIESNPWDKAGIMFHLTTRRCTHIFDWFLVRL